MATQGPNAPGTAADDSSFGSFAWSNPNNAKVSDDIYATAAGTGLNSHYLKVTNFGFSIPVGSTINGILVEIERKSTQGKKHGLSKDVEIKIVKSSGAIGTTNRSTGATWSTSEGFVSFGGAADLWGETWAASDINNSNFGFVVACTTQTGQTGYVDFIRITITYTTGVVATVSNLSLLRTG